MNSIIQQEKKIKPQTTVVKAEKTIDNRYNLKHDQVKQLEDWTSLKCSEILFDSNVYNWSKNTSVLNERIIVKKTISIFNWRWRWSNIWLLL